MPRGVPGPVILPKKGEKKPRGRPFTKGHKLGGRPKGVPNKFTGDLKEAILAGVNGSHPLGVSGFVLKLSVETPTSAAALLGRLIPVSMVGTLDRTILVRHVDETAGDAPLVTIEGNALESDQHGDRSRH
jgi:hypothetical protein